LYHLSADVGFYSRMSEAQLPWSGATAIQGGLTNGYLKMLPPGQTAVQHMA